MKSFTYLLTAALFAAVFSSCESTNPYDQTVFRLEEGPRASGRSSSPRYGYRGEEGGNESRRRRSASRSKPELATTDRGETRTLRNDRKPKREEKETVEKKKPEDGETTGTDLADAEAGGSDTSGSADDKPSDSGSGADSGDSKPLPTGGSKPYANPVPGKYGHVYSPFASGREVDVTGFPPGTEVRCPYTQNIFRVP